MERVTSVEGISEYRLSNGLRVLLFPDESKQTITVNMTYLVGSRHENYGETGMAHMLEHLLFKGTPKHPNINQELTEHGSRANGGTSFDHTNYYETFQATEENLKWALDLEADRMVNSSIAKKDLDSEMTVVRNEWEAGENSPFYVLIQRVMSSAFVWHNFGKPTIGARSDIENVPIERLQTFYKMYYQPDNAVLMMAGKFDATKTLKLVDQYFGQIPKPTRILPKLYTVEPTQDGERTVTVRREGPQQHIVVVHHVSSGTHPDFAAIEILGTILGDTPSGRLHKALVETRKATSVSNFEWATHDPGVAALMVTVPKDGSLVTAHETMLQTIDDLTRNEPAEDEVERARTRLLKDIELNLNDSELICLVMSEYMAMGDWRLYFLRRDQIRKTTLEDVRHVASTYLKPSNRTVGLFIPTAKPDRTEIPPAPDITVRVKDYKGEAMVAMGEAFDSSPANIESRTIRRTAAGELRLALVPKKTRGGMVIADLTFHFGDEKSLKNRGTAGQLVGAMLQRGTTKRTRQQIQDEFDSLKARVYISGGSTAAYASIETTRENLPAVMKLMAEVFRDPSFPANEFEQLKQEYLSFVEYLRTEPDGVAWVAFGRHLSPYPKGDVRYAPTVDERVAALKAVTLDDLKKFYADFYGGEYGEFAVVGDFDDKEITKLAGELFGNWKSAKPYARLVSVYKDAAPISQVFETPDKANAYFVAGMNLSLRVDDPDYPALVLGNWMLGDGFLNSRLAVRIREKEGISYSIHSGLWASPLDRSGRFTVTAICAPQNVARLEAAFKEEMARMLKDGFTADEVKAAKAGWLRSQQLSRAQDSELVGELSSHLYLNRTMAWNAEFEEKVEAVTPEHIAAAMRKHIDPAKITIIKAGDFANAQEQKAATNREDDGKGL
jgi:zinc protease